MKIQQRINYSAIIKMQLRENFPDFFSDFYSQYPLRFPADMKSVWFTCPDEFIAVNKITIELLTERFMILR